MPELVAVAAEVRAQRGAMLADAWPDPADRPSAPAARRAAFLDGFFADIATDQAVAANLLKDCIG